MNKSGNVVGDKGLVGRVVEGALKALVGRTVDAEGLIHNDVGKGVFLRGPRNETHNANVHEVIGRAEPIPEVRCEEPAERCSIFSIFSANINANCIDRMKRRSMSKLLSKTSLVPSLRRMEMSNSKGKKSVKSSKEMPSSSQERR